jgi:adenine-specific DNA methylase
MGVEYRDFLTEFEEDWLIIVIFRDPIAVSKRRVFSDGTDFLSTFENVIKFQSKLTSLVLNLNQSIVLVSYEKLILNMKATIQELIEHLDTKALTDDDLNNIVEKMMLDQKGYRDFQKKIRGDL